MQVTETKALIAQVRVHRRGSNPDRDAKPELAIRDAKTGRLYVPYGRYGWYQLSLGKSGWCSCNVSMPRGFEPTAAAAGWYNRNTETGEIARYQDGQVIFFKNYQEAKEAAAARGDGWTASIGTSKGPDGDPK